MIKDILLWALSKFAPTEDQKVEAWPFPAPEKKPKKATTRKPAAKKTAAKKATTVVKKTTKAKAK